MIHGRRISVHLSVVIVSLLVAVSVILATVQYLENSRQRVAAAEHVFAAAEHAIAGRLAALYLPATAAVELIGHDGIMAADDMESRLRQRSVLARFLDANPAFASAYVGYADGDFVLMRPLRDEAASAHFEAPEGAHYLVQAIERPSRGLYVFYDAGLAELERRDMPDYVAYDPRARPWYDAAAGAGHVVETPPYAFFTTGEVGTSIAMGDPSRAVAGVDVTLASLSHLMRDLQPVPGADIGLVDGDGVLIAHVDPGRLAVAEPDSAEVLRLTHLGSPVNAVLAAAERAEPDADGHLVRFALPDGTAYQGLVTTVSGLEAQGYRLVMAVAERDLFAPARAAVRKTALILGAILLASIAFAVLVARHIARPLVRLAADVGSLRRFDFSGEPPAASGIREIDELAVAVGLLKHTIRQFLATSTAMAGESDLDRLLERLLDDVVETTRTLGGVLYLTSEEGGELVAHAARKAGRREAPLPLQAIPLDQNDRLIVRIIEGGRAVGGPAPQDAIARAGLAEFCGAMDRQPTHMLAAPLFNRGGELEGVLVLLTDEEVGSAMSRYTEQVSAAAAVAIETRQLIAAQRALFESLLRLIAQAIDAKSPYTGGHCARVPALTKMLAAAADRSDDGPYAGFRLDRDDWDAIHVAAWLHDCGKVTTPEYVVDKATKLETIHDRIHEIRMRVEVIKREAEIAHLHEVLREGDSAERRAALAATLAGLDDDFAFVARCNIGGEFMSDDDIARLHRIAERTWTRTLDDRLGLSHLELERLRAVPERPLPAREQLLADRPEHRIERPASERIAPDNPWGFRIDVPELLYDRGELHNLVIRRGTLTDEDRYKINEHMVQTIKMLEALPFPKYLRHVPELAGGHHEKMDGTGYPRQLMGGEMSPVARMMAIADIFEALTAADRPYKKAKTLSESLKIMSFMAKDAHIDPELYDLFLTSGVFREYADAFLRPEQIDEVDIERYRPARAA